MFLDKSHMGHAFLWTVCIGKKLMEMAKFEKNVLIVTKKNKKKTKTFWCIFEVVFDFLIRIIELHWRWKQHLIWTFPFPNFANISWHERIIESFMIESNSWGLPSTFCCSSSAFDRYLNNDLLGVILKPSKSQWLCQAVMKTTKLLSQKQRTLKKDTNHYISLQWFLKTLTTTVQLLAV